MPFQLISAKPNDTIHVQIDFGNQDVHSVKFRHPKKAYSATITADMQYQGKLGYFSIKHLPELPEGVTYGVEGDEPKAPVKMTEEKTPVLPPADEKTVAIETSPAPIPTKTAVTHSQSELKAMDKNDLKDLAATLGLDPKGHSKDELTKMIMDAEKAIVENGNV